MIYVIRTFLLYNTLFNLLKIPFILYHFPRIASTAYGKDTVKNGFIQNASIIFPVKNKCRNRCTPHEGQYVPVISHHGHLGIHIVFSGGIL